MPATPRHDVRACPDCRLTFSSRQALQRHGSLDHRPAPDGVRLTEQIVGPRPTGAEPQQDDVDVAGGTALLDRTAPTAAVRAGESTSRAQVPWVLVAALVGLVVLTVRAELVVALGLLMVAWACLPRREQHTRSSRGDSPLRGS